MFYKERFREELTASTTSYFILDTKGSGEQGDIDFVQYRWRRSKFNKVKEGDLFIYRRPSKSSETGQFYFFGAAKIGAITGDDHVTSILEKTYPFPDHLFQKDLDNFEWAWKSRGNDWSHFFNQYGMNTINKTDFVNLMELAEQYIDTSDYDPAAATQASQDMQSGNYHAEDNVQTAKVRAKQAVFSGNVKTNYQDKCAICSISTKGFLIGSHIIPWAKRKDIRLDPANGICLCAFHDKAFDQGYITVDKDYRVEVLKGIEKDPVLHNLLRAIDGVKINLPKKHPPKLEYLDYHRKEKFEKAQLKFLK